MSNFEQFLTAVANLNRGWTGPWAMFPVIFGTFPICHNVLFQFCNILAFDIISKLECWIFFSYQITKTSGQIWNVEKDREGSYAWSMLYNAICGLIKIA